MSVDKKRSRSEFGIMPVMLKDVVVYGRREGDMELCAALPNITIQLVSNINATLFDFCRHTSNIAALHAVKMCDSGTSLDIAVIDKVAPEKFSKRLQVFRYNVLEGGKLVDCVRMAMLTEPPICPFAPNWGFVEGELSFISNERVPTKSRRNPEWRSSCEVNYINNILISHFK